MTVYTGDRRESIIGLQILFVLFTGIIYGFRVYTRLFIVRSWGVDDWLMGLALLLSIGICVVDCVGTTYGWGLHIDEIVDYNYEHVVLISWLSQLMFTLCAPVVKASILFLYLRIAATKTYRNVIWGSIIFIIMWIITFTCIVIFQCIPVSAYWKSHKNDRALCFSADVPLFIHGMTNSLSDLYVFLLPLPMMWKLQLPRKQRIGLMAIFGVGFITVAAGAIRLYYSVVTVESDDFTWLGYYLWTWEGLEINLGIISACIPCIKPLIIRLFPRLLSTEANSRPLPNSNTSNSRTTRNKSRIFDGGKSSYTMGTVTTATTTSKTKRGSQLDGSESEENLTAKDVILQVTSFESRSLARNEVDIELAIMEARAKKGDEQV